MPLRTDHIRITRRVTVSEERVITVTPVVDSPYFEVEITPPSLRQAVRSTSPQDTARYNLRYWKSPVAFYEEPLNAGDRFTSRGAEWEVLSDAENVLTGTQAGVQFCQVMPITLLYPHVGDVQEIGGTLVEPDIRLALWSPSETHRESGGNYRDFSAQAPIEHRAAVSTNNQLVIGTNSFKILESNINYKQMHMELSIRKQGLQP
jgi:hypothetical protein